MIKRLREWRTKPVEQKSYRLPIFVTVVLLVALTGWSVWDETIRRRPWKHYQNEFFKLELAKVRDEYEAEKKAFETPESQKRFKDLQGKLDQLRRGPADPKERNAYLEAKARLEQLKFKLVDLARDSLFAKSRYDAAYYLYEKAIIEHSPGAATHKAVVDKHQAHIDEISGSIKEVEAQSEPLWKQVQEHDEEISTVEKSLEQMTAKLETLEKKVREVRAKSPKIEQIVVSHLDRVDRCQTCHLAIDRPGFEDEKIPQPYRTHPKLEEILRKHPPEEFACTICHGGQGPALEVDDAHGEVHHWEFPLLRGSRVESSCQKCHATMQITEAPILTRGKHLFEQLGCAGCHLAPGFEDARKVGPELGKIRQKTTLNWLHRWVMNPRSFKPTTRMPQFKLTQDEGRAMAHFLASLSDVQPLTGPEKELLSKGRVEEGQRLFRVLACIGCHRIGEEGETFAPNLTYTGSKVRPEWLLRFLKNPRSHSPFGRMPNMRLKDEEIAHLAGFLLTLKKDGDEAVELDQSNEEAVDPSLVERGKKLAAGLGCAGCHLIPGLENQPRVGAELSTFGGKNLSLLYFGYREDIPHTLWDWTVNKLKNPQIYATERIEQKMPNFYLAEDETKALATLVTGFKGEEKTIPLSFRKLLNAQEQSIEAGRNLVRFFNCAGCHSIEGQGSGIAPTLKGEGAKVQPDWLFKFLKEPVFIRPWLEVRMPKFNLTDDDASKLVAYFTALDHAKYPYEFSYFQEVETPRREREAGEKFFDMFKCISCHPVSLDPSATGSQVVNLGPNLGLARDRLRHEWIAEWILRPEELQPGTRMPTNFPKMGDKRVSFIPNLLKAPQFQEVKKFLEDLFGPDLDSFLNDPAWQSRAIRDHVITLGTGPRETKAQPAAQTPVAPVPTPKPIEPKAAPPAVEEDDW